MEMSEKILITLQKSFAIEVKDGEAHQAVANLYNWLAFDATIESFNDRSKWKFISSSLVDSEPDKKIEYKDYSALIADLEKKAKQADAEKIEKEIGILPDESAKVRNLEATGDDNHANTLKLVRGAAKKVSDEAKSKKHTDNADMHKVMARQHHTL